MILFFMCFYFDWFIIEIKVFNNKLKEQVIDLGGDFFE